MTLFFFWARVTKTQSSTATSTSTTTSSAQTTSGAAANAQSTKPDINTFTDVLTNIDDNLGQSKDVEKLFKDLNALKSSSGAQSADLSNINQRLAAITFMRLNPE